MYHFRNFIGIVCLIWVTIPSMAQNAPENASSPLSNPTFGLAMDIGYATMLGSDHKTMIGWQKVGLKPDFTIGDFGIGLDLVFHFRFNGGANAQSFELRAEDWQVSSFQNFLEVYLPKIKYVQYGTKGKPLYAHLGEINNGSLGNGFIVGGFSNTLHQPEQRISGLSFDLDGALFQFPYVGIETMIGNLAAFDLLAFRVFVRPTAGTGVPMLKDMQIGFTLAADTNPHYFSPTLKANSSGDYALIWGVDLRQPIVALDVFKMNLLLDVAMEKSQLGGQLGLGGQVFGFLTYTGMIRFLGDQFKPSYFDRTYDVVREDLYTVYSSSTASSTYHAGWLARLGVSFLQDAFSFQASMDGSFSDSSSISYKNPDLHMIIALKDGVLGGLGIAAFYDKKNIAKIQELIDPINSVIGARVSYKLGPAVISLVYDLKYDPYSNRVDGSGNPLYWQVNSKLETSIVIF